MEDENEKVEEGNKNEVDEKVSEPVVTEDEKVPEPEVMEVGEEEE